MNGSTMMIAKWYDQFIDEHYNLKYRKRPRNNIIYDLSKTEHDRGVQYLCSPSQRELSLVENVIEKFNMSTAQHKDDIMEIGRADL